MTGPVEFEFEGTFDPALFAKARRAHERRRRHLRLPAQHLRVRSDPPRRREAAGLADAVVVNTCAVTAEAVRQARQAIRRLARERPDARIVVTGCAAQTEPQTFAAMPEVDRVLGNEEKLDAARLGRRERRRSPSTTSWR